MQKPHLCRWGFENCPLLAGVFTVLRGHGLGKPSDGEDGDVVFLAEGFGDVGDIEGGLAGEVVDAFESKQLSGGLAGFDYSVRHGETWGQTGCSPAFLRIQGHDTCSQLERAAI